MYLQCTHHCALFFFSMSCRLALTMSGEHLWDGLFGNIKCSSCAVLIFCIHSIRIIFTRVCFFLLFGYLDLHFPPFPWTHFTDHCLFCAALLYLTNIATHKVCFCYYCLKGKQLACININEHTHTTPTVYVLTKLVSNLLGNKKKKLCLLRHVCAYNIGSASLWAIDGAGRMGRCSPGQCLVRPLEASFRDGESRRCTCQVCGPTPRLGQVRSLGIPHVWAAADPAGLDREHCPSSGGQVCATTDGGLAGRLDEPIEASGEFSAIACACGCCLRGWFMNGVSSSREQSSIH